VLVTYGGFVSAYESRDYSGLESMAAWKRCAAKKDVKLVSDISAISGSTILRVFPDHKYERLVARAVLWSEWIQITIGDDVSSPIGPTFWWGNIPHVWMLALTKHETACYRVRTSVSKSCIWGW
jgi:hypothetical protein